MSRIGNKPVRVPAGVEVKIDGREVTVKGKLGTLSLTLPPGIEAALEGGERVVVRRKDDAPQTRAFHGLARALIQNHVIGVSQGYRKELEIHGVSYQAAKNGDVLELKVGFANEILVPIPKGVDVTLPNPTLVVVSGPDKQKVGQFAAQVRAARPPEPYKGKGIRYRGEQIQRKQGKSFVGSE